MVFDRRPDEMLQDVVRNGLTLLQSTMVGVTEAISTGDATLRDLDGALTGTRLAPAETTEQAFLQVTEMLQRTLALAREKNDASDPVVTQAARETLARVTLAEPSWRPAPLTQRSMQDMFRMALRSLRGSDALLRLAGGRGGVADLEELNHWAQEVNGRLGIPAARRQPAASQPSAPAGPKRLPPPRPARAPSPRALPPPAAPAIDAAANKGAAVAEAPPARRRSSKRKPTPDDVKFAMAVAQEYGDDKVSEWAQQFADGKISEAQWQSRLTHHAAASRESLDDVYERALLRVSKQG